MENKKKNVFARLLETCAGLGKAGLRVVCALGSWITSKFQKISWKLVPIRVGASFLVALSWVFTVLMLPSYAGAVGCELGRDKLKGMLPDATVLVEA